MDSPLISVQENWGRFTVCYHPLFLFTEHGGCVAATLRPGNVHSADDWDDLLVPEIERQQAAGTRVAFRADAAFAKPEIYEALEQRDVDYAIRMPANKSLELDIEDILFRPPGRPSRKSLVRYKSFRYQAKSWTTPRRIVAKVEHHRGELFPRVGSIVTNTTLPSRSVVRFYNKRGTAEQWIKEGKQATHWTRLSCHRFRANEVRLQLSVLAYNLGNLWRRLIGEHWDWWQRLFVPTIPGRSKILALDIPTVVTGPRGCGKTMLFRRLSERLIVECGDVVELSSHGRIAALYVNANDFADAFARYPDDPSSDDEGRLICYANLCVLGDLLGVQSARIGRRREPSNDALLALVGHWLVPESDSTLLVGEDRLERYRAVLEQIKWKFARSNTAGIFPGYQELSQHRWLPRFIQQVRACCQWLGDRTLLLFVDDYSTPRVSVSMQRVLNRLFLQRSADFLSKIATESTTTFVSVDSEDA